MKNVIREYIDLNEIDKKKLWDNAVFVFDTNVFLNLYRYSPNTRDKLIDAFEQLHTKIWMPYQVAMEFCKDRYEVIYESNTRFDEMSKSARHFVDECTSLLRLSKSDPDIEELDVALTKWIEKKKMDSRLITSYDHDDIFTKILDLFDGKVGSPFSKEEADAIEKEGKERYSKKTPPGYKDAPKKENTYGDLFVWKEILNYSKKHQTDIVFVTDDQKEDWWYQLHGKTIGPRIELKKEFFETTKHVFHMYEMTSFLSFFSTESGKTIDTAVIDEVELFSSILRKKVPKQELGTYYDSLSDEKEKRAAKIRFRISRIENKNRKRNNQINYILSKKPYEKLSPEEKELLENNRRNIEKSKMQIEELQRTLETIGSD